MWRNLNNLSLRQLRAMDEVAARGSFVEAAKALHLTPSAMSETIKTLEAQVGLRLFDRSTRHVSLTEAGGAFLQHVRNSLRQLDEGMQHMADLRQLHTGRVRVMGATSALACLVAPCLAGLWQPASRLKVEMRTALAETMVRALREGAADFCVASLPRQADDDIEHSPLIEDQFGLVGHRDHPALQASQVTLRDAQDFPYVGLSTWSVIDELLKGMADLPESFAHPAITMDDTGTLAAVLEQGLGVAILPALVLHQMRQPALRFTPLAAFPPRRVEISRQAGRSLSPAAQALWEAVSRQAKTLVGLPGIRQIGETPA
ncbi:MAG: LysR family transcriptional regulator [Variovorax sp.]|nr:LysR family transcriptional regulator [Variovorax sp.]